MNDKDERNDGDQREKSRSRKYDSSVFVDFSTNAEYTTERFEQIAICCSDEPSLEVTSQEGLTIPGIRKGVPSHTYALSHLFSSASVQ